MTHLSLRRASFLAAVLGVATLGATLARGAEADGSTRGIGVWNLQLDNGSRQCRITLRADIVSPGYGVGMPVGCHRAFPALGAVTIWNDAGDGKLQLEEAGGQPVLVFEPGEDGTLRATSPEGEVLRLDAVGPHRALVLKAASKSGGAGEPAALKAKPAAPVAAAAPKKPLPALAEIAGHYAVLRQQGKDTGCMVTLDEKAHGPKGSLKANLAPACRDQGIVIFDPVGWQLEKGRLVLTARKGHTAQFDLDGDGSWTKDPKQGKSLTLKKL